ncbi:alpha/beta fold hydrolase [Ferrovibrio sp.]|uniref:alpha/beta hydrolase family protein n=1 Tax=Ferrovibrio sp. TaxID=1917215 RepID=UPI001B5A83EF|nr:alpha/beta fold hydrolase [Ferrovibrio sp.]MBP7062798.1 alpha/beta fold hydrolase [Ferrovibrio sp.]
MSDPESITLTAADGQLLAASHYAPAAMAPPLGLALQINSATAVPRRFYDAFARHAAGRGFAVLSYDYRGIGQSNSGRAAQYTMLDWAERDAAAAGAWLQQNHPGCRLCVIGHSFGGQILGLTPQAADYAAALLVASQSGHWRHWPAGWPRLRMFLLWHLLIPLLTRLYGRMPGALFGGEPLPPGVALQWARWGRSRHYISDAAGAPLRPYNPLLKAPLLSLSFSDDPIAPKAAVDALLGYYPAARIERRHIAPADWGLPKLGHFGLFHRAMPVQHWDALLDWLASAALPAR